MATATPASQWIAKGVLLTRWTITGTVTVGAVLDASTLSDKTVQVAGTFSGGTIVIEGTNFPTSTGTYHTLNDSRGEGNALSLTTADTRTILENTRYLRPRLTVASGTTSLTVDIVSQSTKR